MHRTVQLHAHPRVPLSLRCIPPKPSRPTLVQLSRISCAKIDRFFFSTFLYLPLSFLSLSLSLSLSGLCAFLSARCVLSHRSEYREGALDAMNHRSRVAVVAEVRHEGRLRSWKLNNDACIANTARCNRPARQKRFSKAQYERRLVGRPEIMQM